MKRTIKTFDDGTQMLLVEYDPKTEKKPSAPKGWKWSGEGCFFVNDKKGKCDVSFSRKRKSRSRVRRSKSRRSPSKTRRSRSRRSRR